MQYRKMPNCTTGKSPSQLFLNREIRTRVDLVVLEKKKFMEKYNVAKVVRQFVAGDRVAVRNYDSREKWKLGIVKKRLGPVTYVVQVDSKMMRRHANQLLHTSADVESNEDSFEFDYPVVDNSNGDNAIINRESDTPSAEVIETSPAPEVELRRSSRNRTAPSKLKDYVTK